MTMVTPSGDMSPNSPVNDINGMPSYHQQLFGQRKQREFIPDQEKDDTYWDRRRRNNEAAKRSREKRRVNDMMLESRVMELTKENNLLRAQLEAVYDHYAVVSRNTGFTFQLPPLPRALAHIIQPQVPPPLPVHAVPGAPMPRLRFATQGTFAANPRIPDLQTIDQMTARMTADNRTAQLQQLIRRSNEQEQQEAHEQSAQSPQNNSMSSSHPSPIQSSEGQDHSRTPEPEQHHEQPRRIMTPPETMSAQAAAAQQASALYQRIRSQSLGEHYAAARNAAAALNAASAAVNGGNAHHDQSDENTALNLSNYAHSSNSDRSGSPQTPPAEKSGAVSPTASDSGSNGLGSPHEFDEAYHSSASSPGTNGVQGQQMPFKIRFKGEAAHMQAQKRKMSESECEDNSQPKNLKVDTAAY